MKFGQNMFQTFKLKIKEDGCPTVHPKKYLKTIEGWGCGGVGV